MLKTFAYGTAGIAIATSLIGTANAQNVADAPLTEIEELLVEERSYFGLYADRKSECGQRG